MEPEQGCSEVYAACSLIGAVLFTKDGTVWFVIKLSLLLFQDLLIFRSQMFIKYLNPIVFVKNNLYLARSNERLELCCPPFSFL